MADLKRTVEILFQGDDQVSKTILNIGKSVDKLSGDIEAIADPFAKITDGVLALDAALVILVASGLTLAFNASKDYEQATLELLKVMGDGEVITDDLEQQFTDLSRTYGVSTTDIISSLAALRQSGFDTSEGLDILTTSLDLNRASELSTEEATNLLKRALLGYKLEAKDATDIGDLFNQTSNVLNTTVGKLAEGFATVARQAKDSGFSLEQTVAVLTPIIGVFDSGSEAGIAFSTALSRLIDPSKEGEEAIRLLTGVTGPLNEEFKTGKDLFEAVAKGLQDVDDQTGSVAVAQIVGVQQAKRIKVAFDEYFETLDKIGGPTERYLSLQKEVDLQNASSQASVDRLVVGFGELARVVGDQFRDAAKEAIDGGTSIENALADIVSSETFAPIFDALNEFSSDLGGLLQTIAENIPEAFAGVNFDEFIKALGGVGEELSGLFEGIDLTTPEGLRDALQKAVDGLTLLANVTAGIVEAFGPTVDFLVGMITSLEDLDDEAQKKVGNFLGAAKIITDFGLEVAAAIVLINDGAGSLGPTFQIAIDAITLGFQGVKLIWDLTALAVIEIVDIFLKQFEKITFGDLNQDIKDNRAAFELWSSDLQKSIGETGTSIGKSLGLVGDELDAVAKAAADAETLIFAIPDRIADSTPAAVVDLGRIREALDAISAVDVVIAPEVDAGTTTEDAKALLTAVQKEFEGVVDISTAVDEDSVTTTFSNIDTAVEETQKKLDDNPLTPRLAEIELQGEIDILLASIETSAETLQDSLEFKATFDLAELETGAEIIQRAFDSVDATIEDTGKTLVSLTDIFADVAGGFFSFEGQAILEQIEAESNRRDEALQSQRELNEANIRYLDARTDALAAGDGVISVTVDGSELAPGLDFIMNQVMQHVQVRITEDNAGYQALLGLAI